MYDPLPPDTDVLKSMDWPISDGFLLELMDKDGSEFTENETVFDEKLYPFSVASR